MADRVKYWMEIADYDFDTTKAMMETKRYLYVGYMCHQVIEKMLKAHWSSVLEEPSLKMHHLLRLAIISGLKDDLSEEQLTFFDELELLNIEARYPSYKEALATLTLDYCQKILDRTNELKQ